MFYNINFLPVKNKPRAKINMLIPATLALIMFGFFLFPLAVKNQISLDQNKIIELTNRERVKNGLNALTENKLLVQAARKKAIDIFVTQNFNHQIANKNFSDWIEETGYQYQIVGENLALDFTNEKKIIKAWLDSTLHKKNLLNKDYSEIGVGLAKGELNGKTTWLAVQIFARPENTIDKLAFN